MRLLRLRSAWGLAGLRGDHCGRLLAGLRADGWDGVEASLDDVGESHEQRLACCKAAQAEGISLVLSAYSSWKNYEGPFDSSRSVDGHVQGIVAELREIAELHSRSSSILKVNAHSGTDAWSEGDAQSYFQAVIS